VFKLLAGQLPRVSLQWDCALAFALAGILAWIAATTALTFALIFASTVVLRDGRTRTHPSAIVLSFAFSLAGIQPFAGVWSSNQQSWIHTQIRLVTLLFIRRNGPAARNESPGSDCCHSAEIATTKICVAHSIDLLNWMDLVGQRSDESADQFRINGQYRR